MTLRVPQLRGCGGALWAQPAECYFVTDEGVIFRKFPHVLGTAPIAKREIRNPAATLAEKMRVLFQVGAITCRPALVCDRFCEPAVGQRLEAIINCCEGDGRDALADTREDLDRRGMIAFAHKDIVHSTALIRHPQSVTVDLFVRGKSLGGLLVHLPPPEHRTSTLSRTILI